MTIEDFNNKIEEFKAKYEAEMNASLIKFQEEVKKKEMKVAETMKEELRIAKRELEEKYEKIAVDVAAKWKVDKADSGDEEKWKKRKNRD